MDNGQLAPDYQIQHVAIVNSENIERHIPYWYVEIAGFRTVHVSQALHRKEEVVRFIQSHAQAAVCVHRLGPPEAKGFLGAELVATLYDAGIPALLVTQYVEIDQYTSLRLQREKNPIVLHLHDFDPASIKEQLELCLAELRGCFAEERVPYRVMLHVINVETALDGVYVDVSIDCWNHYQILRFPLTMIPPYLHRQIVPGTWLFAHVNIKARRTRDFYFCRFELAPEPLYEENLTYCVNVLDGTGNADFGEEALKRFLE